MPWIEDGGKTCGGTIAEPATWVDFSQVGQKINRATKVLV
jgi:hypothetical protein